MNSVHFSSQSNEWTTPQALFDELNREFHFGLDPASTHENAKCSRHFTQEENGLLRSWDGERVFCNPPYGKELRKWVKKSAESKALVVLLIPARTDTSYFHDYIYNNPKAEIRFLRGRLKFGNSKNSAPFPSMIVVFRDINAISGSRQTNLFESQETA